MPINMYVAFFRWRYLQPAALRQGSWNLLDVDYLQNDLKLKLPTEKKTDMTDW
jgi:hypothetical protein